MNGFKKTRSKERGQGSGAGKKKKNQTGSDSSLLEIYGRLYDHFGPQHWWPAESPFEVIIGAVLTQNTSWKNVEKALVPLRQRNLLIPEAIDRIPERDLASLIRPSGFYNLKARRLKALTDFVFQRYGGSLDRMFSGEKEALRSQLLRINGIGPETADSILLYAGNLPVFVVDAYTRRILTRHRLMRETDTYEAIQGLFLRSLPNRPQIFNEYHALIVKTAKTYCKTEANCNDCPLGVRIGFFLTIDEKMLAFNTARRSTGRQ